MVDESLPAACHLHRWPHVNSVVDLRLAVLIRVEKNCVVEDALVQWEKN
jgi:hypothetical protein